MLFDIFIIILHSCVSVVYPIIVYIVWYKICRVIYRIIYNIFWFFYKIISFFLKTSFVKLIFTSILYLIFFLLSKIHKIFLPYRDALMDRVLIHKRNLIKSFWDFLDFLYYSTLTINELIIVHIKIPFSFFNFFSKKHTFRLTFLKNKNRYISWFLKFI